MWAAGDHDDDSKHALQTGLELVLKMAECKDGDGLKKVATGDASAAARMMYETCRTDAERLKALKLVSRVVSQSKAVLEGCYPADESHWICAKAYNASASHMRARDKHLAEAFMAVAVELCKCTNCTAVTVDMCWETAKKFSVNLVES